jgi:hypothetical protein
MTMDHERDVRAVERWGLLAGVTGIVANALLVAMYALDIFKTELFGAEAAGWDFAWTGPANDVIGGVVSTGAMVPFAVALAGIAGAQSLVRVTRVAVAGMVGIAGSSVLLVAGVVSFERQVYVAMVGIVLMLAWAAAAGRVGLTQGVLPRGPSRLAFAVGVAGGAGLALAAVALLLPARSAAQYAVGGPGLVVGTLAFLVFPVWLVTMSNQVRDHVSARAVLEQDGAAARPVPRWAVEQPAGYDGTGTEPVSTRRQP